ATCGERPLRLGPPQGAAARSDRFRGAVLRTLPGDRTADLSAAVLPARRSGVPDHRRDTVCREDARAALRRDGGGVRDGVGAALAEPCGRLGGAVPPLR